MAYPPPTLPIDRTNALPMQDTHPQDHNAVNQAVNDITAYTWHQVGWAAAGLVADVPGVDSLGKVLPWQWQLNGPWFSATDPYARGRVTVLQAGTVLIHSTVGFAGTGAWAQIYVEHLRANASLKAVSSPVAAAGGYSSASSTIAFTVTPNDQIEVRAQSVSVGFTVLAGSSQLLVRFIS